MLTPPVRNARLRKLLVESLEDRSLLSLGFTFAQGFGGTNLNIGDVATDAAGNEYIAGSFSGTVDMDPGHTHPGNPDILTAVSQDDAFVAKYSPTGAFLWARSAGGAPGLDHRAIGLAVDGAGNVYATGFFTVSATFGPGLTLTDPNGATVFVWKLDTNGTPLWATAAAGSSNIINQGVGIVVDGTGKIDVTGSFRKTITFATISGNVPLTAGGTNDPFIAQINSAGSWVWAKSLTTAATSVSAGFGQGISVASDTAGNVYVAGLFSGQINLAPGGSNIHTSLGGSTALPVTDGFVIKLANNGSAVWGNSYGSTDQDEADGITSDGAGNLYVTGRFSLTVNFDPTHPSNASNTITPPAGFGIYALKLNTNGGFVWVTNLNVSNNNIDIGRPSVVLDGTGNAYFTGPFLNTATIGPVTLTSAGDSDIYVARLSQAAGTILDATRGGGGSIDNVEGLGITANGTLVIGGDITPPATFGAFTIPNQGSNNVFLGTVQNLPPVVHQTQGDYDGDHKADLATYRPTTATWSLSQSTAGNKSIGFGAPFTDIPVPGDYDGDGKTDLAVFRPSTDTWYIQESTGGPKVIQFGGPGDIPIPGNYDGTGKTEIAVYRPSTAQWFIMGASGNRSVQFGAPNFADLPVPGDYDGDGKTDLAVYRVATSTWYIMQSTAGPRVVQFGAPNLDQPVPADYDGDGKTDIAVLRPSTYTWYIQQSTAGPRVQQFGGPGDIPVPEDFDGDGKADIAVYRFSTAQWFIAQSTAGPRVVSFGDPGVDFPMTAPFQYRFYGETPRTASRTSSLTAASASSRGSVASNLAALDLVSLPNSSSPSILVPLTSADPSGSSTSSPSHSKTAAHDLALASALDELNLLRA
ncbi:MAG TPA: FG-GAP-like repeat-containing protein [Isosphaeraceae bacterium]|jgi:hypothetical protein|nr:FG-GAP-like repeat-containing protein [Isosphaeraceae bacterium]